VPKVIGAAASISPGAAAFFCSFLLNFTWAASVWPLSPECLLSAPCFRCAEQLFRT